MFNSGNKHTVINSQYAEKSKQTQNVMKTPLLSLSNMRKLPCNFYPRQAPPDVKFIILLFT